MEKNRHMSEKLDILQLYLSYYPTSYTGREVARALAWNHQTTSKILAGMVAEKLLHKKVQGKNNLYYLNQPQFITSQYIALAEQYHALDRIQHFELKKIIESILSHCETIILFGSFAKYNEKSDSDIDLIIINPTNKSKIEETKKIFPREINIEYSNWKKFKTAVNQKNTLSQEVIKNHILFGNMYPFIQIASSSQPSERVAEGCREATRERSNAK